MNDMCGIDVRDAAMKRAFSAEDSFHRNPGALPQAEDEAAPLALNKSWGDAPGCGRSRAFGAEGPFDER